MKYPLISIITPTYNRAEIIKKMIDSVLNQTYQNWELIIVDDGSTDHYLEVLQHYKEIDSRIHYFERHRLPKGAPTCRNIGLEFAKGDYIIYLDSDDYLLPFCLEQRVKAIKEIPNCDYCVFPMGELKGKDIIKKDIPIHDDYLISFLSANILWQTMCPIWRKGFLETLNGFTEGYPRFTDPELMIRAFLEPSGHYKVFDGLPYDCVMVPSPKDETIFYNYVYKGLKIFIPDIAKLLNIKKREYEVRHLVMYLRLWLKYYYAPQPKGKFWYSLHLIVMFYKEHIITLKKCIALSLRLCHFHAHHILGSNTDKLTNTAYFMTRK